MACLSSDVSEDKPRLLGLLPHHTSFAPFWEQFSAEGFGTRLACVGGSQLGGDDKWLFMR